MARLPRLYLPGCGQHITQRGNNREACFYDEADYHWVEEGTGSRKDTERLKINDSDPIDLNTRKSQSSDWKCTRLIRKTERQFHIGTWHQT